MRWAKARGVPAFGEELRTKRGSRKRHGACPKSRRGSILRPKMLRRFASALMIVLLAGTLLTGASARRGVRECPMSAAHDCCKKAHTPSRSPDMAGAGLCRLVNCPPPPPTGTDFPLRFSLDSHT